MAASSSRIDLAPPAGVCCDCWSWLVVFVFYVLCVACVLCVVCCVLWLYYMLCVCVVCCVLWLCVSASVDVVVSCESLA
jgi:hypothetical protein